MTRAASVASSTLPTWTTENRPASPATGQQGYNTTLNYVEVYNGTDWQVVSLLDKDAENWEDLRFPSQSIDPVGSTAPASRDNNDGTITFSASATNIIAGVAQMPHNWLRGSAIRPHIHWCPTTTGSGNVYWRFEYEIVNFGDAFTGYTTVNTLDAADGTSEKHQIHNLYSTEIAMTNFKESSIMKWRISRIGGDGTDTYAAVARLLEFDIHYRVGKPGTESEIPS
jgi:hypothetical protein